MTIPADKRHWYFGIAVSIIALLVYANSIGNGFAWDDEVVIMANPALKGDAIALFKNIDIASADTITPYYRPLTLLTFLTEERLHGLAPAPMHFFNVLLHAANSFLVYALARTVTNSTPAGLIAGLLFAVHPLNSESVNFLAGGRNTLLACFFSLSSYLVHRRSISRGMPFAALAGSLLFVAGLFSKELAFAVLPFIAAVELQRFRVDGNTGRRNAALRLLPYACGMILYVILRANALSAAGASIEVLPGLGARLIQNIFIIPRYLLSVVWPPAIAVRYFVPANLGSLFVLLSVAWACIIGTLFWLLTKGRSTATIFGLCWLAAFWLPVSGIIRIPSAPLADRYLYLPAIGLWLIIADQSMRFLPSRKIARPVMLATASLLLVMLALLTPLRNRDWKNSLTLFTKQAEQYPDQAFSQFNLGAAYFNLQDDQSLDLAQQSYARAMAIDPAYPFLHTQMGSIRLLLKDFTGALEHYTEALRLNPNDDQARINRAITLEYLGREKEAIADYRYFLSTSGYLQLPGSRQHAEERIQALSQSDGPQHAR